MPRLVHLTYLYRYRGLSVLPYIIDSPDSCTNRKRRNLKNQIVRIVRSRRPSNIRMVELSILCVCITSFSSSFSIAGPRGEGVWAMINVYSRMHHNNDVQHSNFALTAIFADLPLFCFSKSFVVDSSFNSTKSTRRSELFCGIFVCLFVCLFVWGFTSHLRIFHSCGNVTITDEGLQILTYTRHS